MGFVKKNSLVVHGSGGPNVAGNLDLAPQPTQSPVNEQEQEQQQQQLPLTPPLLEPMCLPLPSWLDTTNITRIEQWMLDGSDQATEYKERVRKTTSDMTDGLRVRKALREQQMTRLRNANQLDEQQCHATINTLKRNSETQNANVHGKLKRARGFLDWLRSQSSEAKNPPPPSSSPPPRDRNNQTSSQSKKPSVEKEDESCDGDAVTVGGRGVSVEMGPSNNASASRATAGPWSDEDWQDYRQFLSFIRPSTNE